MAIAPKKKKKPVVGEYCVISDARALEKEMLEILRDLARTSEDDQAKAIAAFKDKATSIAKSFGFSSYTLREVQVNDNGNVLMPYAASARANGGMLKSSMSDSAVPVEAGKARVEVSVSGSVQLR